ncbi:MAG: Ig domain-containing protein, partial [Bacteroides sp.]|nr:Ig domain-containing protein [Bacteroides sp.]
MMKRMTGYILSIMMTLVVIGCCHMDFYEELIISVTGVKLDKEALELVEGDSYQLTATVAPANAHNKKVTWSSSDESIATADQNGKVIAIKEGTAIITVTTEDGGKTATCTVTVTAKEEPEPDPIPVIGVTLDKTELALIEGETAELVAT